MKRQSCRAYLNAWKTRVCVAVTAGATLGSSASAQESRSMAKIVQPSGVRQAATASPEWAVESLRAGDNVSVPARMQAVGILATTPWQTDAATEGALVQALRVDPNESVRAHTATVFASARTVTPKVLSALQCCVAGSSQDGYPGERSAAVKFQAGQALQKQGISANPAQSSAQQQTARSKTTAPALVANTKAMKRGGSEESSPPDQVPQKLPDMPPAANRPLPIGLPPQAASQIKTASAPSTISPLKELPTLPERKPPMVEEPKGLTLKPVPESEKNMTLRDRRNELRDMGLRDSTMKIFTSQVGAPPPNKSPLAPQIGRPQATGDEMPAILKRVFATPQASTVTASDVAPQPVSKVTVNPKSVSAEDEPVKPGAWGRVFARFGAPNTTTDSNAAPPSNSGIAQVSTTSSSPPAAPKTESPGFLSRMFSLRPPATTAPESMPRSVESMGVTPISSSPTLRTP